MLYSYIIYNMPYMLQKTAFIINNYIFYVSNRYKLKSYSFRKIIIQRFFQAFWAAFFTAPATARKPLTPEWDE